MWTWTTCGFRIHCIHIQKKSGFHLIEAPKHTASIFGDPKALPPDGSHDYVLMHI